MDWISYGKWLAAPRKPEFFIKPRILIREITSPRILATYTEEEYYNTPSIINCINFTIDIFFVLGVVNSELISFYHNITSPKANKGLFPKILVNDVRNLPIKIPSASLLNKISQIVQQRLQQDFFAKNLDAEIDDLVYKIYNLNDEEIAYIKSWYKNK